MLQLKRLIALLLVVVIALWTGTGTVTAQQGGTIKIMYTDPLSGPFAQVGDQNLQQFKYILDYINSRGGAVGRKFEIVSFDNKSQPSEALLALKAATDQNMPIIMQRSEEHTSELQSLRHLVCRLLLEKKKNNRNAQQ